MKSPGMAALLTLLLPGLGQAYCGRWLRGAVALVCAIAAPMLLPWIGFVLGPLVYLAAGWDAYVCAQRVNASAPPAALAPAASPLLTWAWTLTRLAALAAVLLACLGIIAASFANPSRLSGLVAFLGAAAVAWAAGLGLSKTVRVARGLEVLPAAAMRDWLQAIGALGVFFGLLAVIVYPSFANLIRKSAEGRMKGELGSLRAAVDDYKQRTGAFPPRLELPLLAKSLNEFPELWPSGSRVPHAASGDVVAYGSMELHDTGHWAYVSSPSDKDYGRVYIDCTHTDSRGSEWASY